MYGSQLLILSSILIVGFLCQWVAWRVKLPSILFLLLVGILVGPGLGWLNPDALFGDLLEAFVSLAVAVILYEGSMTLKFGEIRGHGAVVRNLVTVGVAITWLVATLAAKFLLEWETMLAALFGAIVTVSGPTVIAPLLRTIRPTSSLASIFRWESILVDPLGAILAVLVFDFIIVSQTAAGVGHVFETLGVIILTGAGLGMLAGYLFGVVLRNHWLPDYLRDYAALAIVLFVFALSETVESESGLLAVTIMGVWQANMRDIDLEDILDFKESLTLVLVAALFIVLAARIDFRDLAALGTGGLLVLLTLQLVAGPARALICSMGSNLSIRERLFLGWLFPRGIVAAAVSALFALRLENANYPGADKLVPLVFIVIVGTVIIQSLSGRFVASWLGVIDPEPNGVLVVGANPVALMYAEALHKVGRRVLVASMGWDGVKDARMKGLPVFYGSPVSDYAERHLELMGLGHLLALSHRPGLNELACVRYRYEFGRNAVYTMPQKEEKSHEKHQISGESAGRVLYGGAHSIAELAQIIAGDVEIKSTELTNEFTVDDYRESYPERITLFINDANGRLRFQTEEEEIDAGAGSVITALIAVEPASRDVGNDP
ncbi:MAG: sodium:proton antiporter [Gammaproteobacteria bacterium]|nr:sodium:proton antiporter [Gammaproteobacteria bacterium]